MTTVYRQDLLKALTIYQDAINKKFLHRFMTPATHELMKQEIESLRHHYGRGENNPVWDIVVEIIPSGVNSFTLQPILEGVTVVDRPTPTKRYHT